MILTQTLLTALNKHSDSILHEIVVGGDYLVLKINYNTAYSFEGLSLKELEELRDNEVDREDNWAEVGIVLDGLREGTSGLISIFNTLVWYYDREGLNEYHGFESVEDFLAIPEIISNI